MREILFRGKDNGILNGQWQYGSLDILDKKSPKIMRYDTRFKHPLTMYIPVLPETIGQYTGLLDKNGKKIFEGDIFKPFDDEIIVVSWIEHFSTLGLMVYSTIRKKVRRKEEVTVISGWSMLMDYDLNEREVIGNIHDNPEFLNK